MQVGMQVVGDEQVFVKEVTCGLVYYEFLIEAVAVRCVIVGLCYVLYGYRF